MLSCLLRGHLKDSAQRRVYFSSLNPWSSNPGALQSIYRNKPEQDQPFERGRRSKREAAADINMEIIWLSGNAGCNTDEIGGWEREKRFGWHTREKQESCFEGVCFNSVAQVWDFFFFFYTQKQFVSQFAGVLWRKREGFKQEGLLLTTGFMLRTDNSVQLGCSLLGFICVQCSQTLEPWRSGKQRSAAHSWQYLPCAFLWPLKIRAEMLTSRTQFSGVCWRKQDLPWHGMVLFSSGRPNHVTNSERTHGDVALLFGRRAQK